MLAKCRRGSCEAGISSQSPGKFKDEDALLLRGALQLKLLDAIADLIAIQPEQRRGFRLVPTGSLERLDDKRTFELFEIDASGWQLDGVSKADGHGAARREVARAEHRAVRQE